MLTFQSDMQAKAARVAPGYDHNIPGETYIFLDFPRTGVKGSNGVYRAFIWLAKKYGRQKRKLRRFGGRRADSPARDMTPTSRRCAYGAVGAIAGHPEWETPLGRLQSVVSVV